MTDHTTRGCAGSGLDAATAALATRMVKTIETGDVDGWGATFAPGAVTWHSYDGQQMTAGCIVVQVDGGLVTRLDEYLDSGVVQFGTAHSTTQ